jgi:hypothetical protein
VGVEDWVDMVRVVVPVPPEESVTLNELRDRVRPAGELVVERVTVPAKPPRLFNEMVDAAEEPGEIVTDDGLAAILKSTTLTVTVV